MIIDFITKLLKSENLATEDKFNSILVIVDRLIKYSILVLFKELYTAE